MTWIQVGRGSCPDRVELVWRAGTDCASAAAGFTLIDEAELDRFEEDLTILRIVGQVHWLQAEDTTVVENKPVGYRMRWGLLKQLSDPAQNVIVVNPFHDDALTLPWMTMRETVLPTGGPGPVPVDGLEPTDRYASWAYPANAKTADIDITVKRKFSTHEQLNLFFAAAKMQTAGAVDVAHTARFWISNWFRFLIQHS
jgi:hypothetical protein